MLEEAAQRVFGVRGILLDYVGDPAVDPAAARVEQDGLLVIADGKISARGSYDDLRARYPNLEVEDFSGRLVCPGFVDAHIHYPQMDVMASYGHQLLDWLSTYTFPAERAFESLEVASMQAQRFVFELLRHGTTTALTLCTVHPHSVDALARQALERRLRLILGKVLMDRNAPPGLLDSPQRAYDETTTLIERWHGKGRLGYAITPRFAGTSTPQQLDVAGALRRAHPTAYVHTHLAENRGEVEWMRELFPDRANYTDIYSHHGLLGERTVLAHGVHLQDAELGRLAETRSVLAFCPSSNLFLGSGLFPYARVKEAGVRIALATDVGAGTSFSQLRTMGEAYKVLQLQGISLSPHVGWHLATLGSAAALGLEASIGNFEQGREADFLVLDWRTTPLLAARGQQARTVEELLFALMILGDDRCIFRTYVAGECAYGREDPSLA